jgi:hypothetical protein
VDEVLQIGDNLLQPGILIFETLQSRHLVGQQTRILLTPIELRRLADPGLLASLRHRHTVVALLQNKRLLGVRELRCLHASAPFPSREITAENSSYELVQFLGIRATAGKLQLPALQSLVPEEAAASSYSRQFIDLAQQDKIAVTNRTWQVNVAATAEAEKLSLTCDREFVIRINHVFPPANSALPTAPARKSFFNVTRYSRAAS